MFVTSIFQYLYNFPLIFSQNCDNPFFTMYLFLRVKFFFEKDDVVGIEIKGVTVDDEGFYECIATNKSGKASSKCELLVNGM